MMLPITRADAAGRPSAAVGAGAGLEPLRGVVDMSALLAGLTADRSIRERSFRATTTMVIGHKARTWPIGPDSRCPAGRCRPSWNGWDIRPSPASRLRPWTGAPGVSRTEAGRSVKQRAEHVRNLVLVTVSICIAVALREALGLWRLSSPGCEPASVLGERLTEWTTPPERAVLLRGAPRAARAPVRIVIGPAASGFACGVGHGSLPADGRSPGADPAVPPHNQVHRLTGPVSAKQRRNNGRDRLSPRPRRG
ncbi:hypothetical protein GCM10010365_46000 [Streptomyces poonensis]|uniref:Uncharacterized protein n=1 Tax=Streptomyces poonensis TaxID=68255 RepID=A0A918PS34_9ACTN|nr:hypothetical protein GCM10010365_46000 [Streptomyces poonensis]